MNILSINTSSTSGSIAIFKKDKISYVCYLDIRITHSERLMPQIDEGLKRSGLTIGDINVICIANGPGSFTGIRIGLATAKGLSMPNKIPIVPYNTLFMQAYNLYPCSKPILVFNDAKMNEVYAALYNNDMTPVIEPYNTTPDEILSKIREEVCIVGNGIEKYKNFIIDSKINYIEALPHQNLDLASVMISIFLKQGFIPTYDFDEISELEPYYLRKSQAELVYEKKRKREE